MDPEHQDWVRKVAWFCIHCTLPALKKSKIKILYDETGEPYMFSNVCNKPIPNENITKLVKMTKLRRRDECPN